MKRVFLALIMMVLIIWWYKQKPVDAEQGNNQPNVVSFEASQTQLKKPATSSKTNRSSDATEAETTLAIAVEEKLENMGELTYLAVYRMQRHFKVCEAVIYRLLQDGENFDPVAEFQNRIKNQLEHNPHWPTPNQVQAVKVHANKCSQLVDDIEGLLSGEKESAKQIRSTNYVQLRDQLSQYLASVKPVSAKELAIFDVLALSEIWQDSYNQVIAISKGGESKNQTEIDLIRAEIKSLEQERNRLSERSYEVRTTEESARIDAIRGDIQKLRNQIFDLRTVDEEARNQALGAFNTVNDMLFMKLRSSDADVFFEAQLTLEHSRNERFYFGYKPYKATRNREVKAPFIEYVSPGDVIKSILGFQDNELFALVINYATQLYHCELGADCGTEGEWLPYYCHLGYQQFHDQACSGDLLSFYQNHYFSQNQWQDIQSVLSLIRELYEN